MPAPSPGRDCPHATSPPSPVSLSSLHAPASSVCGGCDSGWGFHKAWGKRLQEQAGAGCNDPTSQQEMPLAVANMPPCPPRQGLPCVPVAGLFLPQETGAVTAKCTGTEEPQHPPLSARRANGRVQLKVKQSKNSHCWAPFGMCSLCSLLMPMALTDARDAQRLFLIQDCCSSGRSTSWPSFGWQVSVLE